MADTDTYIKQLQETHPLREPILREVIQTLKLPTGSHGLDAGCGIGLQALLLAEAVGPTGHLTGLDISSEYLLHAEEIIRKTGFADQISFQEGDVDNLPFENDTFDWVWSADCVGYPVEVEPVPLLKELARVVKPGGAVAILAWSSQMLLPGYQLLEAKLNATCSAFIPIVTGKGPESSFLRALGWFREVGFVEPTVRTFVDDVHAPLRDDIRHALILFFQMLWGEKQQQVSEEDWAEYERLCLPESSDFILNCPDYYAFFTYSMFHAKATK
jgi:ubiquinone/menaquinone biosynthesis C-methylase UbiE